jgi:hypothetical protein
MIWRWLRPAILHVEGARWDSRTFERAYYERYRPQLEAAAPQLGVSAIDQATSFGAFQILGENLRRHHGVSDFNEYLASESRQEAVARAEFYRLLGVLIKRRGVAWPQYLFSCWNAGINLNQAYADKVRRYLEGKS